MTLFDRTERAFTRFAEGIALLGGLGLIFATVVTCLSIILKLARRMLDTAFGVDALTDSAPWLRAILGEEELVTYGVGLALFSALPWVMIRRGHIRIDLFESKFGNGFNRVLDVLADLSLCAIAWMVMTRQWYLIFDKPRGKQAGALDLLVSGDLSGFADRVRTAQESQILGLPLWPTYVVAELCTISFFLVAAFCVLRSLRALTA
ncbi:TRAP transporter small permease subunit [Thalassobius vesicularis]|uniref:TRAP transporter small permease protein n=1 Tax=Thalassobius vesicularis TaxID=1294297 RepID=A0A4S3MCG4_9RHOB|nr:TRAP transporter small permease subunit [Thalassobius vesicularis]THD76539.1 TRAP transporter small permease subunit [Thalassobius vesicularis]